MKIKFLLITLIFLISLNIASAGIELSEKNSQNQIQEGGSATFDLIVKNEDRRERDIFITFPYSSNWRVNVNPYLLRIPSKSIKEARVEIFSLNKDNLGTFDLILNIKSRDEVIKKDYVYKITVLPFTGDEVLAQLVLPERIDPRVGGDLKVKLENIRNEDFEDLEVIVESEDIFSEKRFLDLKIGEVTLEEFDLSFSENAEPRRYTVDVEVKRGNKVIGRDSSSFILAGFTDVVEKTSTEESLFTRRIVISKVNGGTEPKQEKITYETSNFKKYFTIFSRVPDDVREGEDGIIHEWNFILDSGGVFRVEIFTDYINIFWSFVIVILVIVFITQMKKKRVMITKRVLSVNKDKEGISGMKVLLHIKNRSRRPIQDIKVTDLLPMLIGTSPHSFGTLHPNLVKKTSIGNTRLTWNIGELHGGEERIISYVAKSRLSIIGKLILPSAVVSYKRGSRVIKSRSGKLTLLTAIKEEMS